MVAGGLGRLGECFKVPAADVGLESGNSERTTVQRHARQILAHEE